MASHYMKNGAITRKSGLCKNIRNWIYKNINPNNFFPRCYDCSDKNDWNDFYEDFKMTKAISIWRKIQDKRKGYLNYTDKMISTCITIVQRKIGILTGKYDISSKEVNDSIVLIRDKEWDVISEEQNIKKDNNDLYRKGIGVEKPKSIKGKDSFFPSLEMKFNSNVNRKALNNMINNNINKNKEVEKWPDLSLNTPYSIMVNKQTEVNKNTTNMNNQNTQLDLSKYWPKINEILEWLKINLSQYHLNGYDNIWIIKPCNLSRGRGIHCVDKLQTIKQHIAQPDQIIAQKYIENPLIILNRKFDIRQWVLVTGWNPLTLWIWQSPYLRFTAEDYNMDDLSNLYSHLTNNSIAKYSDKFKDTIIEENMWDIAQFKAYLKEKFGRDLWPDIQEKIKKCIILSFDSCRLEIKNRENSHELFGYDFMIDENLNVYLIEVNSSPDMSYSTKVTEKNVKAIMEDIVSVVVDNKNNSEIKGKTNVSVGGLFKFYQGQQIDETYLPNRDII